MGVWRPSDRSDDCESVDCCEDSSNPSGPTGPVAEEPAFPLEGGGGPGVPEADALLVGGVGPLCVEVGGIELATEASSRKVEIDGELKYFLSILFYEHMLLMRSSRL